jgi:hypothetical protein
MPDISDSSQPLSPVPEIPLGMELLAGGSFRFALASANA